MDVTLVRKEDYVLPLSKFYVVTKMGDYVFLHTDDLNHATVFAQEHYKQAVVMSSKWAHKGE